MKYKKLSEDLKNSIKAISDNPRYKSPDRKLKRVIETWKTIIAMHMVLHEDNLQFYNDCHAFQSAVSCHLYKLTYDEAMDFINELIQLIEYLGERRLDND